MIGPEGIYDAPTDNPEGDGDFDTSTAVLGLDPRPTTLKLALWPDMEVSIGDLDGQGDNKDVLVYLTSENEYDYGDITTFFYLEDALSEGETFSIVHNYDSNGHYTGVQFLVSSKDNSSRVENVNLKWQGMIPFVIEPGENINQPSSISMGEILAYITQTNNLNESDIDTNNLEFAELFKTNDITIEDYLNRYNFFFPDDTGSIDQFIDHDKVFNPERDEFLDPPKDGGVLNNCVGRWSDFSHCIYERVQDWNYHNINKEFDFGIPNKPIRHEPIPRFDRGDPQMR
jgi:hypothetical protein